MRNFNDILSDKIHNYDETERTIVDMGTIRLTDIVAPDGIEIESDFIRVGNEYSKILIVTGYPRGSYFGWLNKLYNYSENIDISFFIEPLNNQKVIEDLTKKIARFTSTEEMDFEDRRITDESTKISKLDAQRLRQAITLGHERLHYLSIYIKITASTKSKLRKLTEEIEQICGEAQLSTREALLQQRQGLDSTLPLGQDKIKIVHNFSTSALADCFPFASPELTILDGMPIIYGTNLFNRSLIIFDRFSLNNYNSVTLAQPGYGKSYMTKLEAIRYKALGAQILVIDPEGEYRPVGRAFNGQIIDLSESGKTIINPLDIFSTNDENGDFLQEKVLDVVSLYQVITKKELTTTERKELMDALFNLYENGFGIKRGMTEEELLNREFVSDDFFQLESSKKKMPTLKDLENELRTRGEIGVRLAEELVPITSGMLGNAFNGETNVDLNSDFIVFDVKELHEEVKPIGMFIVAQFIWSKIKRKDGRKRLLVVEELVEMMKNPFTRDFLNKVVKRGRKYYVGLSAISQQVNDFLKYGGEDIVNNCELKFLLKQGMEDLRKIKEVFNLTNREVRFLESSSRGQVLMKVGNRSTVGKVIAHDFEHLACDTNPKNVEENLKLLEEIINSEHSSY